MVTDIEKNEINNRNTSDAIYFNFSYAALKLLGKNLYNNAANAISELVANGLDAKAKNVYVYIDIHGNDLLINIRNIFLTFFHHLWFKC